MAKLSRMGNCLEEGVGENWDINDAIAGSNYVHVAPGRKHNHLNVTYATPAGELHHVEIPVPVVNMQHTRSGFVASSGQSTI